MPIMPVGDNVRPAKNPAEPPRSPKPLIAFLLALQRGSGMYRLSTQSRPLPLSRFSSLLRWFGPRSTSGWTLPVPRLILRKIAAAFMEGMRTWN